MNRQPQAAFVSIFASPLEIRKWCERSQSSWNFIFLSDDYVQLIQWRKHLDPSVSYKSLSSEIESAANKLRRPYISWIAELGHKNSEPAWWASRVSEKNTMVSPLFDNICKLDVAEDFLNNTQSDTIVVVENSSLLSQLKKINWSRTRILSLPWNIVIPRKITKNLLKDTLLFSAIAIPVLLAYRSLQLLKQAIQARIAGASKVEISSYDAILIHTYLEKSVFSDGLEFRDLYFPGLSDFYKSMGYKVIVLPVMCNIDRSYYSAWSWARKSKEIFLNPYVFYKFSDYIFALKESFRSLKLPLGSLVFNGNEIGCMVRGEISRTAFGCLPQILYLRLPMRMAFKGLRFKALVAEFENMIPEKMLLLGFRKHQPKVFLMGYQHGALYPNFLCNFTPKEERSIAPMYDRVICNGHFFRQVLISEGLNPSLAIVGAALRYNHISENLNIKTQTLSYINQAYDIFIPLPLMPSACAEILSKVLQVFNKNSLAIKVLLKPHPMSSMMALLKSVGLECLPSNFQITYAPLSKVFPNCKVVIGLSTCSMFEAAAAGVPIVRVRRECALDLDPLGFFNGLPPPVSSADEIMTEVQRLLNQNAGERAELLTLYDKILRESFHPCDIEGFQAFLP